MSSDNLLSQDHVPQDQPRAAGQAVAEDTEQAPRRDRGQQPDSPSEPGGNEGGPLRRRLRLKPKVDESQAKAIPSLTPIAADGAVATPTPSQAAEQTSDVPPAPVPPAEPVQSASSQQVASSAEPSTTAPEDAGEPAGAGSDEPLHEAPAEAAPPPSAPRQAPVEIPSAADVLDADMEAEIEKALSGGALETPPAPTLEPSEQSEAAGAAPAQTMDEESLEQGTRLTGKIQSVHGDGVFLDLGFRSPCIVPSRQFESGKKPEVGQTIEVIVERFDAEEGLILANLPRGVRKVGGNWDAVAPGQVVDCMVTKTNKGGLEVTVGGLRGFLPASQVELGFVSDLEQYLGQKLRVQIVEANRKKRNLVVSRRACLMVERQQAEEELWQRIAVGQTYPGRVKTIKDYGAFIDIGGVDGFLHVGEISWTRVRHPSDVLREGQDVEVQVIGLDREKNKISLGLKQLTPDPWADAADKYAVGKTVSGTVTRTADFGAFVELEAGVEGLVHISELDHRRVQRVTDVLKEGQEVQVQVREVDPGRNRISLSLKALRERPPELEKKGSEGPAAGEDYQRKRRGPLKGGTGGRSASGGGLFGNPKDFT